MRIINVIIMILMVLNCVNCKENDKELNDEIYQKIRESNINIKSMTIKDRTNGEIWYIGQKLPEKLKANSIIETELINKTVVNLDSYDNGRIKIGWNNQMRIIYIQIYSNDIETTDSLKIGSTREEVIKKLGVPYLEKEDFIRYQNIEKEIVGIIFYFDKTGKVVKIILFNYI